MRMFSPRQVCTVGVTISWLAAGTATAQTPGPQPSDTLGTTGDVTADPAILAATATGQSAPAPATRQASAPPVAPVAQAAAAVPAAPVAGAATAAPQPVVRRSMLSLPDGSRAQWHGRRASCFPELNVSSAGDNGRSLRCSMRPQEVSRIDVGRLR